MSDVKDIIVTTGDLPYPYKVIKPICFDTGSMDSIAFNPIGYLFKEYEGLGLSGGPFEQLFTISLEEIKKRAAELNANAVIGMKYELNYKTGNAAIHSNEYTLIMYGTAVKFTDKASSGNTGSADNAVLKEILEELKTLNKNSATQNSILRSLRTQTPSESEENSPFLTSDYSELDLRVKQQLIAGLNFATSLSGTAGVRMRLKDLYEKTNSPIVKDILNHGDEDIKDYAKQVLSELDS